MNESSGLQVIVVGAGLAGLATAVSLRRQGHRVEIYEKSQFSNEVGAAIALPRNVTRIMSEFGYIPANVKGTVLHRVKMFSHDKAENPFVTLPVAPATKEHDFPSYQVHRVDLHSELRRMALDPHGQGPPCKLNLGAFIKACNPATPSITTKSGKEIKADLLIIADGIKSEMRKYVLGRPMEPKASGLFCYRIVIPMEPVLKDPECNWLTQDLNAVQIPTDKKHRRIVFYPCRNTTLLNIAAIFDDRQNTQTDIDADATVPLRRVLDTFHDFHPRYQHVIKKYATTVRIWPLHHDDPYTTWVNGKTCLVGDAAHPMFPHVAQGGAQCIEDAASLGALLPNNTPASQINARLKLFENVRKPRCSTFQMISYRTAEALPLPTQVEMSQRGYINLAFDYDAVKVAKSALSEAGLD